EEASRIMLQVHHEGRGIVGIYTRDIAATRVEAVLQLARMNQHPLQCVMEPVPPAERVLGYPGLVPPRIHPSLGYSQDVTWRLETTPKRSFIGDTQARFSHRIRTGICRICLSRSDMQWR